MYIVSDLTESVIYFLKIQEAGLDIQPDYSQAVFNGFKTLT